jgi:phosphosulfolactate synthase (CoM biosynthesis protein A)
MMKERLAKLITQFDQDTQVIVAEVIAKERERLDKLNPKGIKDDIEHIVDRVAKYGADEGRR